MKLAELERPSGEAELRRRIDALGPWFQNMELGGVWTAPDHFLGDYPNVKYRRFASFLPEDLDGRSVLDIGCNAGFYAIEMKKRGAGRVLGLDTDERYLEQARFAAAVSGFPDIEFTNRSVYDVGALGEHFDVIVFMGVLYHLRHPLLALDLIRAHVAKDILLFQTLQRGSSEPFDPPGDHPFYIPGTLEAPAYFDEPGYPKLHFVERECAHDWTNWWIPNRACAEAMLRSAGFLIETKIADEDGVYICRTAPVPYVDQGAGPAYPATGREE